MGHLYTLKIIEGHSGPLPKATIETIEKCGKLVHSFAVRPLSPRPMDFPGNVLDYCNQGGTCGSHQDTGHDPYSKGLLDGQKLEIDNATNKVSAEIIFKDEVTENPWAMIKTE
ncbi:MAG: hypothetical protein OJI67_13770 [Prosthecobacter sp.]|nr:hypothetical protein [Prosthecobacter sp.]